MSGGDETIAVEMESQSIRPSRSDGPSSDEPSSNDARWFGAMRQVESLDSQLRKLKWAVSALAVALLAVVIAVAVNAQQRTSTAGGSDALVPVLTAGPPPRVLKGYRPPVHLYAGAGAWADKPDLPEALSDFQAISYEPAESDGDAAIFLIGGLSSSEVRDTLYAYDSLRQEYTAKAPLPQPRHRYGAALLGEQIYVIGGLNSTAYDAAPLPCMDVYHIPTDTWTADVACTEVPRTDTCAAALDGKVYVVAGYTTDYDTLDSVEVFDPATGAFAAAAPLPAPRGDVACAATENRIYALGGYHDITGQWLPDSFHNSNFVFKDNEWTAAAPMAHARGDKAAVALNGGRILVIAGEHHARGEVTQIARHEVELYLPEANAWIPQAPIPTARFRFAAAAVNRQHEVLVFGGNMLCSTGWNDDWENPSCSEQTLASQQAFFHLAHPNVWLSTPEEDTST